LKKKQGSIQTLAHSQFGSVCFTLIDGEWMHQKILDGCQVPSHLLGLAILKRQVGETGEDSTACFY